MIEKVNLRQMLAIVGIGLAMCFMFSMFSKPSTNNDKLQADTDRSLGAIKAEQSTVGVEIDRSQTATGNAFQAISRSQIEIDGSRKAVDGIEAGIREIESILAECQRLTTESKAIFERIDGANQ
jgi:hypothetical protein